MKPAILSAAVAALLLAAGSEAGAGVKISVNFGGYYECPPPVVVAPVPCPPRVVYCYPVRHYYVQPAPVVVYPAPVVVRPAPVVVYYPPCRRHRVVYREAPCDSVRMAYDYP